MTEIIERVLIDGDAEQVDGYLGNFRNTAVIDWRADDTEVVWDFGRFLDEGDELGSEHADDGLTITYNGISHQVTLPGTLANRYETIRAVIRILAPKYDARLVRDSYYSDTHVFLVRHAAWWAELDRHHPERAAELFQPVTAELDFP
ncbi:hypothetical protein ACLQ22_17250 [Micromonospora sp. DT178]|uniref:hypothetical protein n=1 Tax=Micromonospora sp. DT178 TaxID=3393436 RepID=UPI003CEEAA6C